ncbi:hypothetical protein DRO50_01135 [Candidatus Bathyarchaeota archaeon]|nr:MAG: hypothetical protein DRO50_01135 [Candidatus Bathyarchaeota archaeon]
MKTGSIEKAKGFADQIHEYALKTKNRLAMAHAEMLKGMLSREEKDWENAILHFEKSLQLYKSLNAQKYFLPTFAELLYEYGLMYLGKNGEGDKEKAYSFLDQALKIYQKMDAKKKIEKIIAKKKFLTA